MGNIRIESGPGKGGDYNRIFTVSGASTSHQYNSMFEGSKLNIKSGPWSEIVNPDDVGLPSFGLCQWRGERWEKLIKFSNNLKMPWQSLNAQCAYILYECTNSTWPNENKAWGYIQSSGSDVSNAAYHVCRYYERPSRKFVVYGNNTNFGSCPYTSQGTHGNYQGRYWSETLRNRIKEANNYYMKYVQGITLWE